MSTVTLKSGSGYDAPWIVLGSDNAAPINLRSHLLEAAELTEDTVVEDGPLAGNKVSDLSLLQLTALASAMFAGVQALLSPKPYPNGRSAPKKPGDMPAPSGAEAAKAQKRKDENPGEADKLKEEVAKLSSIEEAQAWAKANMAAWQMDPEVGGALKARIAELKK